MDIMGTMNAGYSIVFIVRGATDGCPEGAKTRMNTSDKCDAISLACARTCVQIQAVLCTYNVHADVGVQDGCHGV